MNKQTNEQTNEQTNKLDAIDLLENDFDAFFLYLANGGGIPQMGDKPPAPEHSTPRTKPGPQVPD